MEPIVIRDLPEPARAELEARARRHARSIDAEARRALLDGLDRAPVTLVDLLSTDEGAGTEFEPEPLRVTARVPDL